MCQSLACWVCLEDLPVLVELDLKIIDLDSNQNLAVTTSDTSMVAGYSILLQITYCITLSCKKTTAVHNTIKRRWQWHQHQLTSYFQSVSLDSFSQTSSDPRDQPQDCNNGTAGLHVRQSAVSVIHIVNSIKTTLLSDPSCPAKMHIKIMIYNVIFIARNVCNYQRC